MLCRFSRKILSCVVAKRALGKNVRTRTTVPFVSAQYCTSGRLEITHRETPQSAENTCRGQADYADLASFVQLVLKIEL